MGQDSTERYGSTSGPQDGQPGEIRPISVPPVPAPVPSGPAQQNPARRPGDQLLAARVMAVSGGVALLLFFVCGFVFGGWAWAWLFFLVPGLLRTWFAVGRD